MTYRKRGPLAALWLNDRFGGWSLGEIVGVLAVLAMIVAALQ